MKKIGSIIFILWSISGYSQQLITKHYPIEKDTSGKIVSHEVKEKYQAIIKKNDTIKSSKYQSFFQYTNQIKSIGKYANNK